MRSLNEKITHAFSLANALVDKGVVADELPDHITEDVADMVYGHADGLTASWLCKMRDGHCSLAASLAFDVASEESRLDGQIETMERLLELTDE